jgi:hypothetical protein
MGRRKGKREQSDDKEARPGIEGQSQCGQHLPAVTRSLLHTPQEQCPPACY